MKVFANPLEKPTHISRAGPPPAQGRPLNQNPPRRQRQERTVYTRSQQEELEACFQEKQYPTFDERLELAQKLDLEEHQVQVWFKNRRAKLARERRLQKQPQSGPGRRGRGARAAPPDPAGAASAPGGPEFPQGWDSWMSPQPGPSGILPAGKPTTYSLHQAWGGPERGALSGFLAGPGPGPGPIPAPLRGPISAPAQIPGRIPGPIPGPAQFPGPILAPIPGPISAPAQIPAWMPGHSPDPAQLQIFSLSMDQASQLKSAALNPSTLSSDTKLICFLDCPEDDPWSQVRRHLQNLSRVSDALKGTWDILVDGVKPFASLCWYLLMPPRRL
ncbi:tetra-peptide repeat homeobox protein 1 [Sapajus apella]|uniref:Tetra-peptide repeat homeobox protein 1 n=1 Tax=Sapajus apella TaxID=9515 RepID=A0A6J3GLQ2_SAPAP|nr:tetra-peptide repeat homeobox protein 1 [Sapajus apella]